VLAKAKPGAVFLLNTPYTLEETWDKIPRPVQQEIIDKKLKVYAINGYEVAKAAGMGGRVNTVMQTCFFALSGVLPREEPSPRSRPPSRRPTGSKGEKVVQNELRRRGPDAGQPARGEGAGQAHVGHREAARRARLRPGVRQGRDGHDHRRRGDDIPVSKMPIDGTWPDGHYAVREAQHRPGDPGMGPAVCIQCGKCPTSARTRPSA